MIYRNTFASVNKISKKNTYTTESLGTKKGKGGGHGASARAGEAGSAERGQRGLSPSSIMPSQPRSQRYRPVGLSER